jgi:hypothetical protein
MRFEIRYSLEAACQRKTIESDPDRARVWKAVSKTIGLIETDLRHPSLQTHKYHSLHGPNGEDVFEAYAQNKTPGAYRVFWYYGPGKGQLTIVAITPHP